MGTPNLKNTPQAEIAVHKSVPDELTTRSEMGPDRLEGERATADASAEVIMRQPIDPPEPPETNEGSTRV